MVDLIEEFGYAGVALLMFVENVLPPIPSEVIMPWAGFMAGEGRYSLVGIVIAGSVGSLCGSTVWYAVARRIGVQRFAGWVSRHGHWIGLYPEDVERGRRLFERRGPLVVCLGRMVPGVRTLISIPAGFAEMPPARFVTYSAIGTVAWTTLLAVAGRALGRDYSAFAATLSMASTVVISGLALLLIVRALRRQRR